MDRRLFVPDGVVGQHGGRNGVDSSGSDGVDLSGSRYLHPRSHHFSYRRQEGIWRYGCLLFRRKQHL